MKTKKPCLSCGNRGRAVARGLCDPCYGRAHARLLHTNYPACGAVPVPMTTYEDRIIEHPTLPPAVTALETLIPIPRDWRPGSWGARSTTELRGVDAYNQRRAAEWLAAHATALVAA